MYSLLLMTAVAGSPDAAAFGWRSAGCSGCNGGVVVGCSGFSSCYGSSGYSGCSGYSCSGYSCSGYSSCHGCCGGGFLGFGLLGRIHSRGASCHGCSGSSCHGSSCYGSSCYGSSCYGSSCHGYSSGWGSCYGSGYSSGCWGSCYGSGAGCTGGVACYGSGIGSTWIEPIPAAPVMTAPAAPAVPAAPATSSQGPARLQVELPTSAKLFVDGAQVAGAGATRQFHTPDLPAGASYYYDLRAEVEVNGAVQTEEKRVVVRAGETATASFAKLAALVSETGAVAAK